MTERNSEDIQIEVQGASRTPRPASTFLPGDTIDVYRRPNSKNVATGVVVDIIESRKQQDHVHVIIETSKGKKINRRQYNRDSTKLP